MPAGLRTSQGHEATHLMMASLSIFTMQYGSLLPVLEGHGTALSAPPATALGPPAQPHGALVVVGDQNLQPWQTHLTGAPCRDTPGLWGAGVQRQPQKPKNSVGGFDHGCRHMVTPASLPARGNASLTVSGHHIPLAAASGFPLPNRKAKNKQNPPFPRNGFRHPQPRCTPWKRGHSSLLQPRGAPRARHLRRDGDIPGDTSSDAEGVKGRQRVPR